MKPGKTSRNTWLDTNKKLNKILTRHSIDTPGIIHDINQRFTLLFRELYFVKINCYGHYESHASIDSYRMRKTSDTEKMNFIFLFH